MQYLAPQDGRDDISIPVIMTSGDTDPLTRQLLKDNDNFGMDEGSVHIVTQAQSGRFEGWVMVGVGR
jgi:UDP-sugar pyrophosphorylase